MGVLPIIGFTHGVMLFDSLLRVDSFVFFQLSGSFDPYFLVCIQKNIEAWNTGLTEHIASASSYDDTRLFGKL